MKDNLLVTYLLYWSILHLHVYHISDCNPSWGFSLILDLPHTNIFFFYLQCFKKFLYHISSFFLLMLFPIISHNTCSVLSDLISLLSKKKSGYFYFYNLIYIPFAWKVLLTVFCQILFIFQVSFSWHVFPFSSLSKVLLIWISVAFRVFVIAWCL